MAIFNSYVSYYQRVNNNRFLGTKGLSEHMVPMDPLLDHHVPSPFFGWPLSRPPFSEIPHLKGPEHNQQKNMCIYVYIYIYMVPPPRPTNFTKVLVFTVKFAIFGM